MWTAPAHSTQQKQSHLALPNGRDGLLCLLTGNGAPQRLMNEENYGMKWNNLMNSMERGREPAQPSTQSPAFLWLSMPSQEKRD